MRKTNGIIIEGKVYEAVPKGGRHCSDCDLYMNCLKYEGDCSQLFDKAIFLYFDNVIFRYSQPLTDKINEK